MADFKSGRTSEQPIEVAHFMKDQEGHPLTRTNSAKRYLEFVKKLYIHAKKTS